MTPFFIALQFLTRLKIVNQTEWSMEDFGKSVGTFPFVGLIIGIFLTLIYFIFSQFLSPMPLMLIIVISEFLFTGGLHADGLMDTSDGLFSGREREKKLEIMKDSRVGSFGVVAFVFITLLKWQLLTAIPIPEFIPIILDFKYSLLSICSKIGYGTGLCSICTKTCYYMEHDFYFLYAYYYLFTFIVTICNRFRYNKYTFDSLYTI